jgi:hypothetical protein
MVGRFLHLITMGMVDTREGARKKVSSGLNFEYIFLDEEDVHISQNLC